jgi:ribosome maturation factor RimP
MIYFFAKILIFTLIFVFLPIFGLYLQWKKKQLKGTEAFPSFIITMNTTTISEIEKLIEDILEDKPEIFLVSVRIKPTNNIKVFLDADNGLSIEKCVKINRSLYKIIEELAWYPDGNFSLEVSSPGIDEPLKLLRQYQKNIGRKVEVIALDDTKVEGVLIAVEETHIVVEETTGKNKKAVILQKEIALDTIKQTTVLIAF